MTPRYTFPASEVRPRAMPMLWRDRLPIGQLSVIAGKPGLGKSTFSTTIAAELSNYGVVTLLSNLEDDLSSVTRPRLDAAGADLGRVHLVPHDAAPVLPREYDHLETLIAQTGASCVVLDPIGAHFSPERLIHDRPTLRRLVAIARRTRCAIVAVHHTVKRPGGAAIDAVGGSTGGLVGTARAVYVYGHDPEDEDRRALACVKINGVEEPATLIIEHEVVESAGGIEAGALRFVEEINAEAKTVLRPGKRRKQRDAEAAEWLCLFLAAGEDCQRQVREIKTEGTTAGFPWNTLRRASIRLKTEKVRVGWGGDGFWMWRLPNDHPLREPDAAARAVGGKAEAA